MVTQPDYVQRRIVVEFGRRYVYAYMTTGDGKMVADNEESWKQPYELPLTEVREEAQELYDIIWQHLTDTITSTLQDSGDEQADSNEED